ncbi:Protein of unknown function [Gryllus bimaculatus]|nr:Protein of unknown function [Gryllus bimaculatus]
MVLNKVKADMREKRRGSQRTEEKCAEVVWERVHECVLIGVADCGGEWGCGGAGERSATRRARASITAAAARCRLPLCPPAAARLPALARGWSASDGRRRAIPETARTLGKAVPRVRRADGAARGAAGRRRASPRPRARRESDARARAGLAQAGDGGGKRHTNLFIAVKVFVTGVGDVRNQKRRVLRASYRRGRHVGGRGGGGQGGLGGVAEAHLEAAPAPAPPPRRKVLGVRKPIR